MDFDNYEDVDDFGSLSKGFWHRPSSPVNTSIETHGPSQPNSILSDSSSSGASSSSTSVGYEDGMDIATPEDPMPIDHSGDRFARAMANPDGPIDIARLFPDEINGTLSEDTFFQFGKTVSEAFWPKVTLLPHQMAAVRWLLLREWIPFYGLRGGLLSFVMGMGKTLPMLVVIASDRIFRHNFIKRIPVDHSESFREFIKFSGNAPGSDAKATPASKTTLVLVTDESLSAWVEQIDKFFVPGTFSVAAFTTKKRSDAYSEKGVITYVSSAKRADLPQLFDGRTYDIVFVTYSLMTSIHNKWFGKGEKESDGKPSAAAASEREVQAKMIEEDPRVALFFTHWRRLVSDEIHTFSDPSACKSIAARRIIADRVWGISGTPLQNGIGDYLSICSVLRLRHPLMTDFAAKKYKIASMISLRSGLATESEVVSFCANVASMITIQRNNDTPENIHTPHELAPTLHRLVSLGIPLTQLRYTAATVWTTMPWEVARFAHHPEKYCFVDTANGKSRPLSESIKYFCLLMGADEPTARRLSEYATPLNTYNTDPHQRKSLLSDGQVPTITAERVALRLIVYHSSVTGENAASLIPGEPGSYTTDDAVDTIRQEMQAIIARKPPPYPTPQRPSQLQRIRDYVEMVKMLGMIATRVAQGMHAADIEKAQSKTMDDDLDEALHCAVEDVIESQDDAGDDVAANPKKRQRETDDAEIPAPKKSKSTGAPSSRLKTPATVVYFRSMQSDSLEAHLLEAAQTSLRKSQEKMEHSKK